MKPYFVESRKNCLDIFARGAMAEPLETLSSGTESRRNVVSSNPGHAIRRMENSANPAVNGYLEPRKAKAVKGEGPAPPFV